MGHIFISYSRKDGDFVDRLILTLEQYGFRTWKDVQAIIGGEVWKASISKAVRESDAFLIVLSPQSAGSENVSKELAVATKHARHILPVMYQACKIPDKMEYDLAELQWVDFSGQSFDEALEQLVRALGGKPTPALSGTREVQVLRDFVLSQAARLVSRLPVSPPAAQGAAPRYAPAQPPPAQQHPAHAATPPIQPPAVHQPPPVLNFCIHCGTRILPENTFCTGCGRTIPKK